MTEYVVWPWGAAFAALRAARAYLKRQGGRSSGGWIEQTRSRRGVGMAKRVNKTQRMAASHRRAVVRRKAKAASAMLKAMNPGTKVHAARVKRLKGGGVSIIPVKVKVVGRGR